MPILDASTILEVKADQDEFILLELDKKSTTEGYYELIFEAKGKFENRELTMYSAVFPLHVAASDADITKLYSVGKFYDSPVSHILNLNQKKWQDIKTVNKDSTMYLGPTMSEVVAGVKDNTWKIRSISGGTHQGDSELFMDLEIDSQSKIYFDLEIPIDEEVYGIEDSFHKMLGPNWKAILEGKTDIPE